ncbi:hypothetical protein EYZ11_010988 [Aspergillus tanneri]|uniref:Uncharacterized protein n=1 Tax=Aspergillus tanneri TaxID=1220188 RepID=A0A4V3UN30_9EURO|nr:hypothetical protein EYZ11_010988 [Aspergillus tanneri]
MSQFECLGIQTKEKKFKRRLSQWIRPSASIENFQNTEAQIKEFLAANVMNQTLGPESELPPAYSPSEMTLQTAETLRLQQPRTDTPPDSWPEPLRSIAPFMEDHQHTPSPGAYISYNPFRNEPHPDIRSSMRQFSGASESADSETVKTLRACLGDMFQPFVDAIKPAAEVALDDWLKAAIWWALRGKAALTNWRDSDALHTQAEGQPSSEEIAQGMVDLAKAWWICHQILTRDDFKIMTSDLRLEGTPRGALLDQSRCVVKYLKRFEKHITNFLCGGSDLAGTLGVDKSLWVFYPSCSAYDAAVLDGGSLAVQRSPYPPIAFGDTDVLYSYGSEFVEVTLLSQEGYALPSSMKCVLSFVREMCSWDMVGVISSQTDLVNIRIQSDSSRGATWKDIEWEVDRLSMLVKLSRGYFLKVRLSEENFKIVWEVAHQAVSTDASFVADNQEQLLFDEEIKYCQYINHARPSDFPAKPTKQGRVRLFKKWETVAEGTGKRRAHRGFRIFVSTPPHSRTVNHVSNILHNSSPVSCSLIESDDGSPGIFLQLLEEGQKRSFFLYFYDLESRSQIHSLLLDLIPGAGETSTQAFHIRSYVIMESQADGSGETKGGQHLDLRESLASVIEQKNDPVRSAYGKTILSESLRVVIASDWSSITDRINIVAHDLVSEEMLRKATDLLHKVQDKPSIRRIQFASVDDLHKFQESITGFKVLFDGLATQFLISRRRKMIPIHKQWEANLTRVQVVQQGIKIQIVAFFYQFHRWKSINFAVKSTDEFEKVDQKGEWGIRFKDAKYALPRPDTQTSDYVCLDELAFPTEHDDIGILFQDASVRDKFAESLPGAVGNAPRRLLC